LPEMAASFELNLNTSIWFYEELIRIERCERKEFMYELVTMTSITFLLHPGNPEQGYCFVFLQVGPVGDRIEMKDEGSYSFTPSK
jgi:hypothetical protein